MSGVTRQLTPDQERELRLFADGKARATASKNLIRRDLVRGLGFGKGYSITPFGLDVLKEAQTNETAPVVDRSSPPVLAGLREATLAEVNTARERPDPTAIQGTWTDVESQARYLYREGCEIDDRVDAYEMAEAVLVLLGESMHPDDVPADGTGSPQPPNEPATPGETPVSAADPQPFDPRAEGSVCGIYPREAVSLRVTEGTTGWWCASFSGDGSKPGSLRYGSGGHKTAEEAFAYLLAAERRRTVYG